MKHKQNIQKAKVRKLKNAVLLNSPEILGKIRNKMQLNSIRLEDLECLQAFIFDEKEKNIIPLFLTQIKHAFIDLGCENNISISELEYLTWNAESKIVAEYIKTIRKEMQKRKVNNLIF